MSLSMNISKSGIKAFQRSMDALSNDIANTNTTGYKSKNVSFSDLLTNTKAANDKLLLADGLKEVSVSTGTKSAVTSTNVTQGSLVEDQEDFHLAITGDGFFRVTSAEGEQYYTRDGAFHVNADKTITNDSGDVLEINQNSLAMQNWSEGDITITEEGNVLVKNGEGSILAGTIPIFYPADTGALIPQGENKYSIAGGVAIYSSAEGTYPLGAIQQHFLESSNVNLVSSFTDMIVAQRAYSMNMKAAQSTDEMMGMINGFKR
ncbi:flagella basal body rod protein [Trichococcus palustris]|uniref:Flagella basal body rod protein n=1 Tax=Trichococcus palustris TaxID=140314 RepID=A0A143Z0R2_9LACT|nr:flagellar hook-basal body protein [Trichococcus palustris]CZR02449.1 flagella basal body rod protein [Trichococcus palustris]SFL13208.1 flagellar basal-body rod protein FlgG [Trichococcus palustris]